MKTLYGILGVGSEATAEQIEQAHARYSSLLQNNAGRLPSEELNNQRVAVNDAYRTLSNPILRQRYDQKLADAEFVRQNVHEDFTYSESRTGFFSLKSLALLGVIALTGLYFYNQNIKEREKLRIQHEHEVQMKAVQIIEDQQRQNAKVQDVMLEKSSAYSDSQQLRQSQQQFERESAQAQQLENQRRQLELQQQQQLRRDEENRARLEQQRH